MRRQIGAAPLVPATFLGEPGLEQTRHAHPSVVRRPDATARAAAAASSAAFAIAASPWGKGTGAFCPSAADSSSFLMLASFLASFAWPLAWPWWWPPPFPRC